MRTKSQEIYVTTGVGGIGSYSTFWASQIGISENRLYSIDGRLTGKDKLKHVPFKHFNDLSL